MFSFYRTDGTVESRNRQKTFRRIVVRSIQRNKFMKITMNKYRLAIALRAYFFCVAANSHAQGPFLLTSGSVGNIDGGGNVDFSLTFNQVPDFFTVDQFGRQANSFQFYIATSPFPGLYPPRPYASLIRGEEIHVAGDLRVRNDNPPDPDPNASGWGSIQALFRLR